MPRVRSSRRAWGRRPLPLLGAALLVVLVAYLGYLNHRITKRLGSDPARARSRFYADRFRIVPGMDIEGAALLPRLDRLGYRMDPTLSTPGTWRRLPGAIEIRLRAFRDPQGELPERRARLSLSGTRVDAIADLDRHVPRAQATLEPMRLDATWSGRWEARVPVRLADLPPHVPKAILATEDARFYQHSGVDFIGVLRAAWVDLRERRAAQGASTLTQQLAKNFFLTPERTVSRKLQEVLLAWLLEARMSKDEILEWYLNEVYLGSHGAANVIGIGEAARVFFDKDPRTLTVGEAATIAGIIRAPNANSPLRHPEHARARRSAVIDQMRENRFISEREAAAAKTEPLRVRAGSTPGAEGLFFLQEVRRRVEDRFGDGAVEDGRLDIYTTLDPFLQSAAESRVRRSIERLERSHRWLRGGKTPLEGSFVLLDTRDGAVRVLVGGRDFARRPFDRAVRARRQAGSTFKPFVYLAAFETQPTTVTASMLLDDSPLSIRAGSRVWQPVNYDERFRGRVTVRTALENSLNVPTVRLSQRVGVEAVAREAAAAGWPGDLPRVPALALGVAETSLLDLAGAYTIFPRGGMPVEPYLLHGVIDPRGRITWRHAQEPRRAANARAAFLVHHLLEGVVERGTARSLRTRGFTGPLAGKTGTTNDYRDAWFVGYTPGLVGAAWVGFDDGRPLRLSSAATALEVWASAMGPILPAFPAGEFEVPPGIVFVDVDPASGLLPAPECPRTIREAFLAGTEPNEPCVRRWDVFTARGPIQEPIEASARILGGILRSVTGIFGGGGEKKRREEETGRRRKSANPIDRMERELNKLRDAWSRGGRERER